jgi:hypothetical protein
VESPLEPGFPTDRNHSVKLSRIGPAAALDNKWSFLCTAMVGQCFVPSLGSDLKKIVLHGRGVFHIMKAKCDSSRTPSPRKTPQEKRMARVENLLGVLSLFFSSNNQNVENDGPR